MRRTRCSSRMVIAAMTLAACGGGDEPGTGATTVTTESSSEPSGPPPASSEPGTTKPSPSEPTDTTKPGPPASLPAPPASPPASDSTAPMTSQAGDDPVLAAAVDEVARRRGVGTGAVYVAVDERVTWRDGSIGCPESGKLYTQALVPGRRVVLRVDGRDFAYHAARSRPLRYCANPSADGTSPGGGDT